MTPLHYPSLELCKKLTEAGFPEETSCHFRKNNSDIYEHTFWPWNDESYVCPSVMELLDEMPNWITVKYKDWDVWNYKLEIGRQWTSESIEAYYAHYVELNWAYVFCLGTLPNALAEMWLWLKENNYLTK